MLKIADKPATEAAVHPRRADRCTITMVEARHLPADTRAELAAHYLADPAMLEPTGVLAKFIFRVSLPRIKTAQAQIDTSGSELERAWARATDGDTAAFIRNHAMQMLREIDRITHP